MFMCVFNLTLYTAMAIIYQTTNSTKGILQKDFCNLRNTSIVTPLLMILTLISFQFTNPIFLCIMLIGRSIFKLTQIFQYYQRQIIQRIDLFYGPFFIYISLIGIISHVLASSVLQNYVQSTTLIIFGVMICHQGIQKNYYYLLNLKLNRSSMLKIVNQVDEQNKFAEILQKVNKMFQNQARILISIYLQRLKVKLKQSNNFDLIWKYFVRKMVNHKLNCVNVTCECRTPARSGKQFQNENAMFLKTIMNDFQANIVTSEGTNLKLLKIYATLQIHTAPLKAHHELISLCSKKLGIFQQLQVEALLSETQQCFDKIFMKQKVQNQSINMKILIQSEQMLRQIKLLVEETVQLMLNYHEKILQSSCQMKDLRNQSKILIKKKKKISESIIFFIQNYQAQSQQLKSLIFLYQKYLQPYQDEHFEKILDKASLQQRLQKTQIDVFQLQYGAIQIDLVKSRGKIVNITNNLCTGFGHHKSEMLNKNINNFMPRIFGKHHDRDLNLTGTMTQTKDINSTSQNFTNSQSNLDSQISMTDESKQKKMSTKQRLKYFQDMFIPFLSQINVTNLKGVRIKYKYSIIQTAELNCDLIQIVSIDRETTSKYFLKQTVLQMIEIAKLYEIQDKISEPEQEPVSLYSPNLEIYVINSKTRFFIGFIYIKKYLNPQLKALQFQIHFFTIERSE